MTVFLQYLGAMLATLKRDALIFMSYRLRIATQILTMLFSLTMFKYIAKLVRPTRSDRTATTTHLLSWGSSAWRFSPPP